MSDETQDQTDQRDAGAQDQHDDTPADALGDKGKAAIDAERKARRDAEKRAKDAEQRLADLEAAERKRAEDEATAQGKWQELAEKREADLAKATADLTTTTATLETLEAYVKADVAAVRTQIAEAAKHNGAAKVLLDFHPGDEADTAALLAWTAKAKAQLPELTATEPRPGHRENPKGDPTVPPNTDADKAARARMRPRL